VFSGTGPTEEEFKLAIDVHRAVAVFGAISSSHRTKLLRTATNSFGRPGMRHSFGVFGLRETRRLSRLRLARSLISDWAQRKTTLGRKVKDEINQITNQLLQPNHERCTKTFRAGAA
jgi:hypothetical protein